MKRTFRIPSTTPLLVILVFRNCRSENALTPCRVISEQVCPDADRFCNQPDSELGKSEVASFCRRTSKIRKGVVRSTAVDRATKVESSELVMVWTLQSAIRSAIRSANRPASRRAAWAYAMAAKDAVDLCTICLDARLDERDRARELGQPDGFEHA